MPIIDLHNDFLIEKRPNEEQLKQYFNMLTQSEVETINFAFWTSEMPDFTLDFAREIKQQVLQNKQKVNNNTKVLFSIEDFSFFDKYRNFKKLFEFSPFCVSLTWNYDNCYAGGAFGVRTLTTKGKEIIKNLQRQNIFVDTAHLNRKSFWEFEKINTKPILNTHCGLERLKHHQRNLTTNQVQAIIESGGFVGLCFVKDFYSKKDMMFNVEKLAQGFASIFDKFGCDNFGIGSDFYGTKNLPNNLQNYNDFIELNNALQQLGMKKNERDKIFYKNFNEFCKRSKVQLNF